MFLISVQFILIDFDGITGRRQELIIQECSYCLGELLNTITNESIFGILVFVGKWFPWLPLVVEAWLR